MFRRPNRILLAAGAAVAVIAAMAGPAGARTVAGANPGAAAASTPVPVDVTGDITWTYVYTPLGQGQSGNDTQTVTAHIGLTGLDPVSGQATGNTSTYSLTDNLNETTIYTQGCEIQLTGNFSGSGPVAMNGSLPTTSPAYGGVTFNADLTQTQVGVHISYVQAQTTTFSGGPSPYPCTVPSTNTSNVGLQANPGCYPNTGPIWPGGPLQGTYPNATVNLGCSATGGNNLWREDTTITGTLTITPSCGSGGAAAAAVSQTQASPAAAASACGLVITSPPDKSIIAISDPQFVDGAEVGANDRAPGLEKLKLKVSGTSAGCQGPVTVNGVSATPNGGDGWDAELPITALGLGSVTLTAKAAGCNDVTSTVTLISLNITNPAENDSLAITNSPDTGAPVMPSLDAKLSVVGYSGDTSDVTFDWTLNVRGETVIRPTNWQPSSQTTTGSTTGTGEAWKPSYDHIIGGVGWLQVQASLPGVTDNPVTSFPRWFNIPGTNPPAAIAKSFVDQIDPDYADTIRHLVCIESGWHQFNTTTYFPDNNGQKPIPNVPADWTPNPGVGQPLFNVSAGIGISQLDPASLFSPDQYWDWQANLQGGKAVFHDKLHQAQTWADREQARLSARLTAALDLANTIRTTMGLPKITMPLITVPPLTDQQAILQAIRYYNGGNEFHFNADYVLTHNNTDVKMVGTGQWEGGTGLGLDGVKPSPAGKWGPASADLQLRQPWVAFDPKFQGYVKAVLKCKNS